MNNKTDLCNFTREQLAGYFKDIDLPPGRAVQVFAWLQRPGIGDFAAMTGVRQEIRATLAKHARISRLTPSAIAESRDGTVKYGFRLDDGAVIESVLIPDESGRHTLCVSSQAGCAMGCGFCLTGSQAFVRNLRPAEMVNQVLAVLEQMIQSGVARPTVRELINNLVFMGMGEPLANYDNLITALAVLMDAKGLEFTARRVTVSTCGIVPRLADLARDTRVNLAVSLHAADDATRSRLMPINRTHGLEALLAACRAYPLAKGKRILMEYVMLQGINDSPEAAQRLADRLAGIPCRINLLPYNASACLPYACSSAAVILEFQAVLRRAGFRTLIRDSRGADIGAACGQLAGRVSGPAEEQSQCS
ncbi:MAG: 23S rRNA (adenine(2503)-C(2))-methyltransferase [Deltaproteobacteria bacterium RIFOXYD12_FULL_57_12]|nr:MAG: 23S rRNA (adenine(2503)-C(2))-methyltransferase [Deltaproteobacteria bacterium RIFOXYD12_FULL_57_12]